jgi:hypothetical protein
MPWPDSRERDVFAARDKAADRMSRIGIEDDEPPGRMPSDPRG